MHPKLIQDDVSLFYFFSLQNEASLGTWKIKTVIVTRTLKRYRGIHADVIVYIFVHLHKALLT